MVPLHSVVRGTCIRLGTSCMHTLKFIALFTPFPFSQHQGYHPPTHPPLPHLGPAHGRPPRPPGGAPPLVHSHSTAPRRSREPPAPACSCRSRSCTGPGAGSVRLMGARGGLLWPARRDTTATCAEVSHPRGRAAAGEPAPRLQPARVSHAQRPRQHQAHMSPPAPRANAPAVAFSCLRMSICSMARPAVSFRDTWLRAS